MDRSVNSKSIWDKKKKGGINWKVGKVFVKQRDWENIEGGDDGGSKLNAHQQVLVVCHVQSTFRFTI